MAIGSNSVIHYTEEFSTLKAILSERGFKVKYCLEKVNTLGGNSYSFAVAMVSFCDIPLTDYKKHFYKKSGKDTLGYYGDYGIGLNRSWVEANQLNPVLYIDYHSALGTSIRKSAEKIISQTSDREQGENLYPLYTKNVKGQLERKGKVVDRNYRFYDEREWRYVPDAKFLKGNPRFVTGDEYTTNRKELNDKIADPRIRFTPEDITYIIIRDNDDLESLFNFLTDVFPDDYLVMMPKIITSKQIIEDF